MSSRNRVRKLRSLESLESRNLLTIVVDTLVDEFDGSITDGDISLRDAIAAADAGDRITLDVEGEIQLDFFGLGPLSIDKALEIVGPGAGQLEISGPFTALGEPQITIDDGNGAVESPVTISGVDIDVSGQGLISNETLVLRDVAIPRTTTRIAGTSQINDAWKPDFE